MSPEPHSNGNLPELQRASGINDEDCQHLPAESGQANSPSDSLDGEKHTLQILMIEDDTYYYRFVRQLLSRHKAPAFELIHASSLAEAIRVLDELNPATILLDLHLPDGDGLACVARMREVASGVPVIILTGTDDAKIGLESVSLGAQDYLIKQEIKNESLIRCLLYSIERRKSEESIFRLSAIRDFTATLAHDLQVPLIGSRNVFDAVLAGRFGELSPSLASVLSDLQNSNRDQLLLVQKLLEIYQYDVSNSILGRVAIDVKALLAQCVFESVNHSDREIPIAVNLPDDLPPLFGNRDALYSLFCSLLDNAFKYSDGLEAVSLHGEITGTKLTLQLHNSGPAIPEQVQAGIFEKFWQGVPGKSYVSHTGLGLYRCNRIVRLHQGKITCHSTMKEGTTITVRLPSGLPSRAAG